MLFLGGFAVGVIVTFAYAVYRLTKYFHDLDKG